MQNNNQRLYEDMILIDDEMNLILTEVSSIIHLSVKFDMIKHSMFYNVQQFIDYHYIWKVLSV